MKYLTRIFESQEFKDELTEFCEFNLAYLVDDGLQISNSYRDSIGINYSKYKSDMDIYLIDLNFSSNPKFWSEIKDDMIPFLIRLKDKYQVSDVNYADGVDIRIYLQLDNTPSSLSSFYLDSQMSELINDNLIRFTSTFINTCKLTGFRFVITGYKQPKKSFLKRIGTFFKT